MMQSRDINRLSTVALPVKLFRDDTELAIGTGFFYLHNGKYFFITAGHNFTGTHPETHENFGMPNRAKIFLHRRHGESDDVIEGFLLHEVNLLGEDEGQLWLEHPAHGRTVDVVAVSFEIPSEALIVPINSIQFDQIDARMGMDLFVLGYPHGYYSDPHILPIWKRGSLATEYSIDIERLPKFYIDTATAKGMSGAPVIAQTYGLFVPQGEPQPLDRLFRAAGTFVGIYTGRHGGLICANCGENGGQQRGDVSIFDVQIGIVWKDSVIEEIINQ